MNNVKNNLTKLTAVLLCFFTMGIVDIVGVSTSYIQQDLGLDTFSASFIPMMVFLWFALFSIPTGAMMQKIGKKNTVLISIALTIVSLILPFISYTFPVTILSFALIGIANTILQVSLNPLVTYVVQGNKVASTLTFGQFLKAVASFLGPIIASVSASRYGDWRYVFIFFAITSILSMVLLYGTAIQEQQEPHKNAVTFRGTLGLLKNKYIRSAFFGILLIVGLDVGMNTNIILLLKERLHISTDDAAFGISLYFAAKTAGAFFAAFLMLGFSALRFMMLMLSITLAALLLVSFSHIEWILYGGILVVGFCSANVFSVIFSTVLQYKKEFTNEISALMIIGVAGGAIITPLIGFVIGLAGISGGFLVLTACAFCLLIIAIYLNKEIQ